METQTNQQNEQLEFEDIKDELGAIVENRGQVMNCHFKQDQLFLIK